MTAFRKSLIAIAALGIAGALVSRDGSPPRSGAWPGSAEHGLIARALAQTGGETCHGLVATIVGPYHPWPRHR